MAERYRYRTQHLRGTTSEWANATDFKPLSGEIVIEIAEDGNYHKLKIGDGEHSYGDLAYLMAGDEIVTQVLPRVEKIQLDVNNWIVDIDKVDAWYQDIVINGVTPKSRLDLQPSMAQVSQFKDLNLTFTTENHNTPSNNNGLMRICLSGNLPLESIEVQASIVETNIEDEEDVVVGIPIIASATVDKQYDDKSLNAQSGVAVAMAIKNALDIFDEEGSIVKIEDNYDPYSVNAQSGIAVSQAIQTKSLVTIIRWGDED